MGRKKGRTIFVDTSGVSKPRGTKKDKMQDKQIRKNTQTLKQLKNNKLKYHDVVDGGYLAKSTAAPLVITLTNVPSQENAGAILNQSRSDKNITGLKFKFNLSVSRYRYSASAFTTPDGLPYPVRLILIRRPITAGGTPTYASVMQGNSTHAPRHFDHHTSSFLVWDKLFTLGPQQGGSMQKTWKIDVRIPKADSLIGFDANSDPPVAGDTVSNHYYLLIASGDDNTAADGNSDMNFILHSRLLFED